MVVSNNYNMFVCFRQCAAVYIAWYYTYYSTKYFVLICV